VPPPAFKYDVAFSFLDRDEALAGELAQSVARSGLTTFIYSERQAEIAAKDGVDTFSEVFLRDARIVVVLYRTGWGKTKWTRIEETAIKDRVLNDGSDFLTFIHLDNQQPTPVWLPKARLWVDLARLGTSGAVAVIEERASRAGAAVREETVEENAARLRSERELAARRAAFLDSHDGVAAANTAAEEVYARMEALRDAAECDFRRAAFGATIYRKGYTVTVVWEHYINTLNDSSLTLKEWDGRPDFGGQRYHSTRPPRVITTDIFAFDVTADGEMGWRHTTNQRLYTGRRLGEDAVKRLLERVRASGGSRDGWA
jgi:hypothetical protein